VTEVIGIEVVYIHHGGVVFAAEPPLAPSGVVTSEATGIAMINKPLRRLPEGYDTVDMRWCQKLLTGVQSPVTRRLWLRPTALKNLRMSVLKVLIILVIIIIFCESTDNRWFYFEKFVFSIDAGAALIKPNGGLAGPLSYLQPYLRIFFTFRMLSLQLPHFIYITLKQVKI